MDDLTSFVDFVAMRNQEATKVLFEQILSRYTLPKELVTDQAAQSTGSVFKKIWSSMEVKKK